MFSEIKNSIFFLIFAFAGSLLFAQNNSIATISLDGHVGYIMVHRYNMRHLVQSHIFGSELSFGKTTYDDKLHNHLYNFPEKGISAYFANLGNPKQLGNVYALIPYMSLPLNKSRTLHLKVGTGLGFFHTTYNQIENNLNNVVSSNFTVAINSQLQKKWKLSETLELYSKLGMTHFSNAAVKMPNLGINLVTTSIGVRFNNDANPAIERKNKSEFEKNNKTYLEFGIAAGYKEVSAPGGIKYAIINSNLAYIYPLAYKSELLLWADVFHDRSLEVRLAGENWSKPVFSDFIQTGIMGGYRIRYNKLSFMLTMGAYTYSRYKGLGDLYHRVGIRYQLTNKLSFNTTLKTHFAIADFAEWGIVYRIK
jgi:hypothetical protein